MSPEGQGEPTDPLREILERKLGHQYSIRQLLGRGGMGAVYLAYEDALDRLVAIKVLPPDASDQHARERFKREARTAARLQHPNIVPLYTFGVVDDMMYFVMGYVDGESLAAILARDGKVDERRARSILGSVANALDYAHQLGIIHRDIKPDNILIDGSTQNPMLADFGIAKAVSSTDTLTALGSVVGTPHYMSPEQATGERDVDGRSDIYALGVVGYRMLTGALPYDGETVHQVLTKKLLGKAPSIAAVVPDVTPMVESAVMRCLKSDPNDRWPNAREFENIIRMRRYGEGDLPDELKSAPLVTTLGLVTAIGGVIASCWNLMNQNWEAGLRFGAVETTLVGLVLFGLLVIIATYQDGVRKGFSRETVLATMFRPPHWWYLPLPRFLRPVDDIWEQLPEDVQRFRTIALKSLLSIGIVLGILVPLVMTAWSFWVVTANPSLTIARPVYIGSVVAMVLANSAFVAQAARSYVRVRRRLIANGLSETEATRVLDTPTFGTDFWERPNMAAILKSDGDSRSKSSSPVGTDHVKAVEAAAANLPADDQRLAQRIRDIVRSAAHAIDTLNGQIRSISADVEPYNVERVRSRLAQLSDTPEDRELRELLSSQLQVAQRFEQRLAELSNRRTQINAGLQRLTLEIQRTRARGTDVNAMRTVYDTCDALVAELGIEHETVQLDAPNRDGPNRLDVG